MTDWLPADHLVWFVIDAVGQLDTAAFHRRARLGGVGRRGFDPDMLVTLLVYAMAQGLRSSRRIEALCRTDVALRIICAGDVPDHTVIARFRRDHEAALGDLLTASLLLCARLGMLRLGVVALDGVKIAANASRDANRGEASLRRLAVEHLAAAAATDQAEDTLFGPGRRGDEIPEKLHDRTRRGTRIRQALDEITAQTAARAAAQAAARATATDYQDRQQTAALTGGRAPTGRRPKTLDPVTAAKARWDKERVRHQARIDDWHARYAATGRKPSRRTPVPADQYCRVRDAKAAYDTALAASTKNTGSTSQDTNDTNDTNDGNAGNAGRRSRQPPRANLTDPQSRRMHTRNGWIQGYNCQTATSHDRFILHANATQDANDFQQFIPTLTALTQLTHHLNTITGRDDLTIGTLLADAGYDSTTNLTTPGPARLIPNRWHRKLTPPTQPPPPEATERERLDHELTTPAGKALYRQRSPQAETSHAWLKDHRQLRHFTRRGLTAAHHEIRFAAAVTNLLRLRTLTT